MTFKNPTQITYCTGLWLIAGNQKRSAQHYLKLIPRTCELIASHRLVLHCDDAVVERNFREHARAYCIDLHVVPISIGKLPFSDYAPALVESCARMALVDRPDELGTEKGIVHYWRDYRGGGPAVYGQMLAIWLSKIALACRVVSDAPSDTKAVAWIDASIGRIRGKRTHWDFTRIKPRLGKIQHYSSPMTFKGESLSVSGAFLQTDATGWNRLVERFETGLNSCLHDNYAHDEETILSFCRDRQPSLFRKIGRPLGPLEQRVRAALFSK